MGMLGLIAGMGMLALFLIIVILPIPVMLWALVNCLRNPLLSSGQKVFWSFLILFIYPIGFCRYPFMYENEGKLRVAVKVVLMSWAGLMAVFILFAFLGPKKETTPSTAIAVASDISNPNSVVPTQTTQPIHQPTVSELYQKCQQKEAAACTTLGEAYNSGVGVKGDKKNATYYFTQACTLGDARGCGLQGEIMHPPWGNAPYKDIGETFLKGCQGQDDKSCTHLVSMVTGGLIEITSYKEDVNSSSLHPETWIAQVQNILTTKCEAKVGSACRSVGKLLFKGIGGKPDLAKALAFFEKGCDLDMWEACGEASKIYLSGAEGIPKNPSKGMDLATKSLDGSMKALKSLER